jgi:hypothetical protein
VLNVCNVSIFHSVVQQLILVQNDMVRSYVFDIGIILISLRTKEFFSLRDVGSTYLTVDMIRRACWIISVNFIHTAIRVSDLQFIFLREGQYCCLAICSVIKLSSFYLVAEVISVRLE